MRGYPKHIATKQDYINLLSMPEFRGQAMKDLAAIRDVKDGMARIALSPIDAKKPEGEWNTKKIANPNPLWKQKGFSSRREAADLISEQEVMQDGK